MLGCKRGTITVISVCHDGKIVKTGGHFNFGTIFIYESDVYCIPSAVGGIAFPDETNPGFLGNIRLLRKFFF